MTRISGVIATECQRCPLLQSCPASKLETPTHVRRAFDDFAGQAKGAARRLRRRDEAQLAGEIAADHKLGSNDMMTLFRLIRTAEKLAKLTPVSMKRAPELSPVITGRLIGQLFLGEAAA